MPSWTKRVAIPGERLETRKYVEYGWYTEAGPEEDFMDHVVVVAPEAQCRREGNSREVEKLLLQGWRAMGVGCDAV
jgi:hypothetical protein